MGCESCSNGSGGMPAGCRNNGTCSSGGCNKLAVYDWLGNMELPGNVTPFDCVEVRFKNSRKEFYRNATKVDLNPGDAVIVEASLGYDLGIISASGELARLQMETKKAMKTVRDLKTVLHKAGKDEIEKWRSAREREEETMYRSRTIAIALGLEMKISDVEFQADNIKATFYYTADGRVDFRELIKRFAEEFRVRIEMKQIGARQEAGRLGGIGSCGRELCCSTWLTDFRSVTTSAARYQQLALNTQKLAGQCGKLKCCLNYELDAYLDALKDFPKNHQRLKTKKGVANHLKTDIFKGIMWYVLDAEGTSTVVSLRKERVAEIIELNKDNQYPPDLKDFANFEEPKKDSTYGNVVGQDSLTRFDEERKRKKKTKKKRKGHSENKRAGTEKKSSSPKNYTKPRGKNMDEKRNAEGKSRRKNQTRGRKNKASRKDGNSDNSGTNKHE